VEVLAFHQSNKSPSRILKMETPKTKYHANAGRNHGEDIELRQPLIFKGINETANGIREQSGTRASFCLEMRESLADEESAEASPKAEHIKTPLMLETPNSQKGAWRASYSLEKILGIQPDGEIVAILLIYFVQGALGLARLATTFFLKDELHLAPAEQAAIAGILALPWMLKPVYGFVSDGFPILGSKRRSYIFLSGILGAASYFALSQPALVSTAKAAIIVCMLSSLSVAVSDVVADSIVVEKARKAGSQAVSGTLQSFCWGSSSFGSIISAYYSGHLLELMTTRQVFGITAVLPLLVCFSSLLVQEETQIKTSIKAQVKTLWTAIKEQKVWLPALFVFLWQGTPTCDTAFFYFLNNELHISPEFFGKLRLVGAIASLSGVWIFQKFLKELPITKLLAWSTVVGVPLGFLPLVLFYKLNSEIGIPNEVFMFGDDIIMSVLGQIAFMPTLILAARLCPVGVEGALFATLMSIFNGGSAMGSELGALLTKLLNVTDTNFSNFPVLLTICNLSSLLPLPLLVWIEKHDSDKSNSDKM